MATEILRKQPKDKKIDQIIQHFKEGKSLDEVTHLMRYKQPKNLTRFMQRSNYRWSKEANNFVYVDSLNEEKTSKAKHLNTDNNVLKNPDVLELLVNAKDVMKLFHELENDKRNSKFNSSSSYSIQQLYQKAKVYNQHQNANITKSLRIPSLLNEGINHFSEETGLNQKQIICVALEYFLEKHAFITDENKEEKTEEKNKEE